MKTIKRLFKRNTARDVQSSHLTTNTNAETEKSTIDEIVYTNSVDFEAVVPIDILKTILLYFSKDDVLSYYNVNKRWRSVVDMSYNWKSESLTLLLLNEKYISKSSILLIFHI